MDPTEDKTPEQKDIEYLQQQLEKTHVDPYRYVDKQTLTDSLYNATQVEHKYFRIALQESLALLRDAHTYVPGVLNDDFLPIECNEIDGHYYITGSDEKYSSLLFQELLSINGYTLEEIFSKISQLSSQENKEILLKDLARFVTSNAVLQYYGFSKSNTVDITTTDTQTTIGIDKEARLKLKYPLRWTKEEREDPTYKGNKLYHFRIVNNTLLFQYNACSNTGHTEEELAQFKKDLLESLTKVDSLVVDLRENDGGNTRIMEDLFEKLPKDKKIYVAMSRKSFSSAIHHLLFLKQQKGAKLMGENAGQRPNRFGDRKEIVLPNSGIRISCSYKYFELLPGQDTDVIEPDIRIPITIEDYRNNNDPLNKWIKDNL